MVQKKFRERGWVIREIYFPKSEMLDKSIKVRRAGLLTSTKWQLPQHSQTIHGLVGTFCCLLDQVCAKLGRDEINTLFAFQILKNALIGVLGIIVGILSAKNLKKNAQHS